MALRLLGLLITLVLLAWAATALRPSFAPSGKSKQPVENTLIGAAVVVVLATMTVIAVADVRNLRRVEQPVPLPTKPSGEAPRFLTPSPAAGSPVPPA
jgi:hypothetical protein